MVRWKQTPACYVKWCLKINMSTIIVVFYAYYLQWLNLFTVCTFDEYQFVDEDDQDKSTKGHKHQSKFCFCV